MHLRLKRVFQWYVTRLSPLDRLLTSYKQVYRNHKRSCSITAGNHLWYKSFQGQELISFRKSYLKTFIQFMHIHEAYNICTYICICMCVLTLLFKETDHAYYIDPDIGTIDFKSFYYISLYFYCFRINAHYVMFNREK